MTTKEKLLELFESNRGLYFSGEDIAKTLCLSRAAVWKAVKSLQSEGYAISAITNRGYCLSPETDILSSSGIQKYLNFDNSDMEICVLPTVTSTNAYVREKLIMVNLKDIPSYPMSKALVVADWGVIFILHPIRGYI